MLYRPSGEEGFSEAVRRVSEYVNQRAPSLPNILMVGGFNMRHVDWNTGSISGAFLPSDEKRSAELLSGLIEKLRLSQIVDTPTRGQSVLDLVLTNDCDLVQNCKAEDTGISDHRILKMNLFLPQATSDSTFVGGGPFKELNFFASSIDWRLLSEAIAGVEWGDAPADSVDALYHFIVQKLLECCRCYVPKKETT